ncbi:MAG: flagellar biosynthetic protein FliR [Bryobacteraceae bacterium]|jgi:flagellar biosynthetic protein FliR
MPVSATLSFSTLCGFLLTLARVSGALVFVPLPCVKGAPEAARVVLAVGFTLALAARWPAIDASAVALSTLAGWAAAEAGVGIAIGASLAIALEAFALAAQVLGLQAGYGYASTVDPNTEADSGVLLVFAQLIAGMLFFAAGLDREVLRLFARSLETVPVGRWAFGIRSAEPLIRLGSGLFSLGARLALPVVALLVMVDVALALLGRLNQQLQLLSLAFPAKMLVALWAMSWTAALFPRLLTAFWGRAIAAALRAMGV